MRMQIIVIINFALSLRHHYMFGESAVARLYSVPTVVGDPLAGHHGISGI